MTPRKLPLLAAASCLALAGEDPPAEAVPGAIEEVIVVGERLQETIPTVPAQMAGRIEDNTEQ